MATNFKSRFACDRRVYDKRGLWKNPNNDVPEHIFYFVKTPLTLTPSYKTGREELAETLVITIYGGKQIAKEDNITLADGREYKVTEITIHYIEESSMLRDRLKPRIECMDLSLE